MGIGSGSSGVPGLVEVNAAQAAANIATVPQAVLDDSVNGSLLLHLAGEGPAPTIAVVLAGAGTAGTATLAAGSTDLCGKITLVTGSASWGTGAQCTVTFGTAHQNGTYVALTPAEAVAGAQALVRGPYAVPVALTGFSLAFAVADSAAHTTSFFYQVLGN